MTENLYFTVFLSDSDLHRMRNPVPTLKIPEEALFGGTGAYIMESGRWTRLDFHSSHAVSVGITLPV